MKPNRKVEAYRRAQLEANELLTAHANARALAYNEYIRLSLIAGDLEDTARRAQAIAFGKYYELTKEDRETLGRPSE